MDEFSLIDSYFNHPIIPPVELGVGDDAAIIASPLNQRLVICMDTLNQGVHFFANTTAEDLAYKAVAVNISDLIAMGAMPSFYLLSISLPESSTTWLKQFSAGLRAAEQAYGVQLVGGDTTSGPLSVTVQATGTYPVDAALITRSGAKAGDKIIVSGALGAPAYAVEQLYRNNARILPKPLLNKLLRPQPSLAMIDILRQYANSAIDISDGLTQDLGHIAEQSQLAANINLDAVPIDKELLNLVDERAAREYALTGGDEYQLCFTVAQENVAACLKYAEQVGIKLHVIGEMAIGSGLYSINQQGNSHKLQPKGWQHFD